MIGFNFMSQSPLPRKLKNLTPGEFAGDFMQSSGDILILYQEAVSAIIMREVIQILVVNW